MELNPSRSLIIGQTEVIDIRIVLPSELKCTIINFIPLQTTVIIAGSFSSQRQPYTG
jgi:hypothetical protein